jgi:hypothetical protein
MPIVQANSFTFYQINFDITLLGYGSYYEVDETVTSPSTGVTYSKMSDMIADLLVQPVGGVPYTDVIVLNHGYFKDAAAAQADFVNWVNGLLPPTDQLDYNPLIVAPHWPSKPFWWVFPVVADAAPPTVGDSADRPALQALLQAAQAFIPGKSMDTVLPDSLVASFNAARTEALAAGEVVPPELASGDTLLDLVMDIIKLAETIGKGDLDMLVAFALLALLFRLFVVPSFAHFAKYGQIFGSGSVAPLVSRLAQVPPLTVPPRFHAMGHSLGTGVTGAMLATNAQTQSLPTFGLVFLAEGAISQWIFATSVAIANDQPGTFMNMMSSEQGQTVSGPVLSTLSLNDFMLTAGYQPCALDQGWTGTSLSITGLDLGDYAPIGLAGIAGPVLVAPNQTASVQTQTLGQTPSYQAGQVYNLDGTGVISGHSDIFNPAVGQAFAEGLRVAIAAMPQSK